MNTNEKNYYLFIYYINLAYTFFYANGSTVLIFVNFDDGNWVNPVFLFTYYYLWTIFIPGLFINTACLVYGLGTVLGLMLVFCIYLKIEYMLYININIIHINKLVNSLIKFIFNH